MERWSRDRPLGVSNSRRVSRGLPHIHRPSQVMFQECICFFVVLECLIPGSLTLASSDLDMLVIRIHLGLPNPSIRGGWLDSFLVLPGLFLWMVRPSPGRPRHDGKNSRRARTTEGGPGEYGPGLLPTFSPLTQHPFGSSQVPRDKSYGAVARSSHEGLLMEETLDGVEDMRVIGTCSGREDLEMGNEM